MAFYDSFLHKKHGSFSQQLLVYLNKHLAQFILKHLRSDRPADILEIGPGKGYFYHGLKESGIDFTYSAMDRNKAILEQFKGVKTYVCEVPNIPELGKKFDIIYAAFVVEHLNNGREVYEFIASCKKILKIGGLIVFQCPDAARQKFEFWNIDYTHIFPTTKRNMMMAFHENGIEDVKMYDINGLCTHPHFDNRLLYRLERLIMFPYSYAFMSFIFWPLYRKPLYDLHNFWYSIYCFFKEENLLIIAKVD